VDVRLAVVYPAILVPEPLRWIHSLNPLVGIDRVAALRADLAPESRRASRPAARSPSPSRWSSIGIVCFARMERSFADVV
jgi:hypothetical protein